MKKVIFRRNPGFFLNRTFSKNSYFQLKLRFLEKYSKKRRNYNYIKYLNENIFNRDYEKEINNILNLALQKELNEDDIIQKLDIYSLGITITKCLYDVILKEFDYLNNS